MAQQVAQGFAQNAPGAFAFTTYASEADAMAALDRRDVAAALIVGPAGPRLVVAGASGDAVAGGITAAFTGAFHAQGKELPVEVVHPFSAGDPHGIVLFFLLLATLVSSVVVGALAALGTVDRSWTVPLGIVAVVAVGAGVVGTLAAVALAGGYSDGVLPAMGVVALLSFAVAVVVAGLARLILHTNWPDVAFQLPLDQAVEGRLAGPEVDIAFHSHPIGDLYTHIRVETDESTSECRKLPQSN
jgi:hypothetical protein